MDLTTASKCWQGHRREHHRAQSLRHRGGEGRISDGPAQQGAGEVWRSGRKVRKTATGQWEIFGNQIDNLKEDLGAALLPVAIKVFGALIGFIDSIRNNPGIKLLRPGRCAGRDSGRDVRCHHRARRLTRRCAAPLRFNQNARSRSWVSSRPCARRTTSSSSRCSRWSIGSTAHQMMRWSCAACSMLWARCWMARAVRHPRVVQQVRVITDAMKELFGWIGEVKKILGNLLGFAGGIVFSVQGRSAASTSLHSSRAASCHTRASRCCTLASACSR